jgi:hypothetical protein
MAFLKMPMMGRVRSWAEAAEDPEAVGEFADALAYFRRVLREEWKGWEKGSPLATYFHTSFQGGPREWVRLYRLIRALDGVPNLEALLRSDLGSSEWTEYLAAVMSLEFCGPLRAAGHSVELIETGGQQSPPDARVHLGGRWTTVEFKALHQPDNMKVWDDLMDWALNEMSRRGVRVEGIEVHCEPAALVERKAFLDGVLDVYRARTATFQELPCGTGRARFKSGNVNGWTFPVKDTPELLRVASKLAGSWWKKFGGVSTPTVLVVRTGMLFGETPRRMHEKADEAATLLREVLVDTEMVGAVLIYDELLWQPPAPAFFSRPEFRLSIGAKDGGARAALIVPNPRAANPLTSAELDVLVADRMLW